MKNIDIDEYTVWPVYYGEKHGGEKYRVTGFKKSKVVYERLFDKKETAEKYIEVQLLGGKKG